jgi:hypothetical protein
MNHLARFSSMVAALCLGLPAAGLAHDHHDHHINWHGDWHGNRHGHFFGPSFGIYAPVYGYYGGYPYYSDGPYADYYDSGPSFGVSVSTAPDPTYRGARVDDRGDALSVDVQRALRRDGYYRGDIDGDIGNGTRAAIREYQYDHRLEVTGRIYRALLRSLGLD